MTQKMTGLVELNLQWELYIFTLLFSTTGLLWLLVLWIWFNYFLFILPLVSGCLVNCKNFFIYLMLTQIILTFCATFLVLTLVLTQMQNLWKLKKFLKLWIWKMACYLMFGGPARIRTWDQYIMSVLL